MTDYMASLELALKNEATEMKFYQNESQRSKNPLAKKMFDLLANDEKEHMQRIRHLHEKLIADGTWPKDVPIEIKGTNVRDVLNGLTAKLDNATRHDDDDMAALEKAADFEAKGSKFYAGIADTCKNSMEKNFFMFLSRIEREHHLSLVDSISYLKDPQTWMMEHERAGLDGA
jgi:rubrerythrin